MVHCLERNNQAVTTITETDRMPVEPNNNDVIPAERVLIVEDDPVDSHRLDGAGNGLGISDRGSGQRRGSAPESHHLPSRHHRVGSGDAADGRSRAAASAQGPVVGPDAHPAHGAGHGRERGRGDQGRRVRLLEQAGRSAAAADPAAEGGRAAGDAARGASAPAPAARAGKLRPDHRQQPGHSRRCIA